MILAGIDIGTNTLRLLIAETDCKKLREIYSDRRITRLGRDMQINGRISPEAEARSMDALAHFAEEIKRHGVAEVAAVGTSALRMALNAAVFLDRVKKRTGIEIKVIDGEDEALLTLKGVAAALGGCLGSKMVIDIGGGSTEIILTGNSAAFRTYSLQLGAVYLTERYLRHDPPLHDELNDVRVTVRNSLSVIDSMLSLDRPAGLIGTAGTITTFAAMDQGLEHYDPAKINNYILTRDALDRMVLQLASMPVSERRGIRGLEPGREDIILTGGVIAQEIVHRYGYESIIVSDWGLREGIVLDLCERISNL